ncbi:hypothetical protein MULP_04809 [Mycobacterium liflandii 128FXT]|uniref:Lipoprotein n=1 Tax=Mycobacterium liflandii (strain 128FXT) TaxID=459424 RepID=L7VCY3_MYCL1|nr:hypothetical protein [Mycobacterium ulcerans]AGC64313.1 hypothetical protein MULP_04809 [Mycobacterium liflandii 128FXT]RFZ62633.1 hypothetical protein BB170200_01756 [Mycobacterium marinum]
MYGEEVRDANVWIPRFIVAVSLSLAIGTAACDRHEHATKPISTSPAQDISSPVEHRIVELAISDISTQLGIPVGLNVRRLNASGTWAFLYGQIVAGDAGKLDYSATPFADAAANGLKTDTYAGLFQASGGDANQRWTRVDSAIGPTDLAWSDWAVRYAAPAEIFDTR